MKRSLLKSILRRVLCPRALVLTIALVLLLPVGLLYAQSDDGPVPSLGESVRGDLRIVHTAWSKSEGGTPLASPITFDPGELVFVRARLAGFRLTEVEFQRYRVFLTYEVAAYDFRGIQVGEPRKDIINEAIHKEDSGWLPTIEHSLFVPPLAEFGDYEVRIKVRDEISQRRASFTFPFHVNGKRLPSLESVSVINFGFYRGEGDRSPMPEGAYRPGSTLWARFDVAGFQVGDRNRFEVVCDVQIRNEQGEVLFQQPEALKESAAPEYPRRYIPGVFSLEIKPGTPRGKYSIAVLARDVLSGKTVEEVIPFTVE